MLAAVALAPAGCAIAITQPRGPHPRALRAAAASAEHRRSREHLGTSVVDPHTSRAEQSGAIGERSPQRAIADFATLYVNWTARSLTSQLTLLALASVGQARVEMSLAAAATAKDQELHAAGIVNSGTVEAVAPLLGGLRRWVVVTRERTGASASSAYADLAPAWHVTLATVARLATGRWVVSRWQPES
jgi:hypothetical protein